MSEAKPFASLSSGLLARKGTAKPAMRPQGFGQVGGMGMEDLGWNDMGYAQPAPPPPPVFADFDDGIPERVPSKISALTPAPKPGEEGEFEPEAELDEHEEEAFTPPPVVEQQRAIEASFAASEEEGPAEEVQVPLRKAKATKPADVVTLPARPRQKVGTKGKAAFTLRLDAERHLKLRLACAVTHRSAQQIVSEALDDFLDSLPELDAMAGQVPKRLGKPS
jgi:hypothetical protein